MGVVSFDRLNNSVQAIEAKTLVDHDLFLSFISVVPVERKIPQTNLRYCDALLELFRGVKWLRNVTLSVTWPSASVRDSWDSVFERVHVLMEKLFPHSLLGGVMIINTSAVHTYRHHLGEVLREFGSLRIFSGESVESNNALTKSDFVSVSRNRSHCPDGAGRCAVDRLLKFSFCNHDLVN